MRHVLASFAILIAWTPSARADEAHPFDPAGFRGDFLKDQIDLETDTVEIHRDRAALRAARDAYEEAVDKNSPDSPQAKRALKQVDAAQFRLHKDMGDYRLEKETNSASRLAADPKVQQVAVKYNVQPAEIEALRKKGVSWIDIADALVISKLSGKPLSEIMEQRAQGKGWGGLCRKYNLKPSDVAPRASEIARVGLNADERIDRAIKVATERSANIERGAHGGHGRSERRR
jgi:hypothetical protein